MLGYCYLNECVYFVCKTIVAVAEDRLFGTITSDFKVNIRIQGMQNYTVICMHTYY